MSMASSNIALLTDADKTKLGIVQSEIAQVYVALFLATDFLEQSEAHAPHQSYLLCPPAQINNILATLQQDIYAEYFKKTAKTSKQFFQELRSLDSEVEKKLKEIAKPIQTGWL